MSKPPRNCEETKLSQMGFFIRICLVSSMWLSTLFMMRFTFTAMRICDLAVSNAVAVLTQITTVIMSLLLICPKSLVKYDFILYELMIICTVSNVLIGYIGPGECIPILSDNLKFSHLLASFCYGMSFILIAMAPKSKLGILTYEEDEFKPKIYVNASVINEENIER